MPFTPSHPAAALPIWPLIRRGVIPMAPFVIGAMVPDFEYLFRLEPLSLISHSARGILVFCLPVGALTWLLWEWMLRPVGRDLVALPPTLAPTPPPARGPSLTFATVATGVLALLLGSVSHVTWDAFTHRYTWVADRWALLSTPAFAMGGTVVLWHSVFQHLSTILGAGVVLRWFIGEWQSGGRSWRALGEPRRLRHWAALGAAAFALGLWNAPRHGQMIHVRPAPIVVGRFVVGALDGMTVAFVLLAVRRRFGAASLRT